jgi:arginine N-succinyltransferase
MLLVRPVAMADLSDLLALARLAGVGLTTLPKNEDLLARRIRKSVHSMGNIPDRPGGESYLFVMQDTATGSIIGASGVVSKVGGFEPFYAYRIERLAQRCDALGVNKTLPVLNLVCDHNGPAEIGSLFLTAGYRGTDAGRFLQLVRFLFVAQHREAFESMVVSELRGVVDGDGESPFWNALGRHFFEIDFPQADRLSVVNKKFIAELMPTHPIYLCLLPPDAQRVVGQVHEHSRPALRTLEAEGFAFNDMVDIFDGGACVSCARDEIRTVRQCRSEKLAQVRPGQGDAADAPLSMVARSGPTFRACLDRILPVDGGISISAAAADVLHVQVGEPLSVAPLRAPVASTTTPSGRPTA